MKKNQPKPRPKQKKKKGKGDKPQPAADSSQPVVQGVNVPVWGEPLHLGSLGGDSVIDIPVPLNQAAIQEMSPLAGVALVLHRRLTELEDKVKLLERDLNLHHRIARLEAALGEGPGASDED